VSDTTTTSLCPYCLRRLPATVARRGDEVWLERTCPEHGEVRALVWRGPPGYDEWRRSGSGPGCGDPAENPDCPTACGLCAGHVRQTCCVLLEVTARCDLECPICFAGARRDAAADPSLAEIGRWYRRLLARAPGCNVQLSGGEPTVRDDLPQVVALGRSLGIAFLQLNTNGLRLASEPGYAATLAAAGLQTVFLQFDGVDDAVHRALRGRPLAALKERAVEHCARAGLGVVLVPTVVRGVNLDELDRILDFALERLPAVRGIHLQPLALLGRYPDARAAADARVTLPEVMRELAAQSAGRIALDDLVPGDCEHALCSFSREYLRTVDGALVALRRDAREARGAGEPDDATASCGCGAAAPAVSSPKALRPTDKAAHVARRWSAPASTCCGKPESPVTSRCDKPGAPSTSCCPAAEAPAKSCCDDIGAPADRWDDILQEVRANTFSVSAMAFQDAWTLDLERLRHCYLHVLAADGRFVPFCAYNLTGADGRTLGVGRPAQGDRSRPAQGGRR